MSRNGSGTYSLPSGNPVVSNTPISSVDFNATMNDLASGLTQSISNDGQTVVVANLPMSGFKHQSVADAVLQNEYASFKQVAGSTTGITAAATVNLGSTTSNNIIVNGDVTITSFGTAPEGTLKFVRFAPVFGVTITHSSSLQLPGAINIKASIGDAGIFKSLGSGSWECLLFRGYGENLQGTSLNGGQLSGLRNLLINGCFRINQRGYQSGILPSVGNYAHDRWKLAGGAPYTYVQNVDDAIITLGSTPATSVISQTVEDVNCEFTNYTLSWSGNVEGRINTTSGLGVFGPSPVSSSIALKGTPITVEFRTTGTGGQTLQRPQLEGGTVSSVFERRHVGLELNLCQRYYERGGFFIVGYGQSGVSNIGSTVKFTATKRASPTITQTSTAAINCPATTQTATTGAPTESFLSFRSVTTTGGVQYSETWTAEAEL